MADDEMITDDGADVAASDSKKKGGIGALVPFLLKWVAIGLGVVIFLFLLLFFAFSFFASNKSNASVIPVTEEYTVNKEVLDWYSSIGAIRTRTNDVNPASVVVDVVFGYKKDDKNTSSEITQRNVELRDFLRRYFSQKTYAELRPQNEESLRIEIRNAVNDTILSSSKIKDVRFMQLDVIQQ